MVSQGALFFVVAALTGVAAGRRFPAAQSTLPPHLLHRAIVTARRLHVGELAVVDLTPCYAAPFVASTQRVTGRRLADAQSRKYELMSV